MGGAEQERLTLWNTSYNDLTRNGSLKISSNFFLKNYPNSDYISF